MSKLLHIAIITLSLIVINSLVHAREILSTMNNSKSLLKISLPIEKKSNLQTQKNHTETIRPLFSFSGLLTNPLNLNNPIENQNEGMHKKLCINSTVNEGRLNIIPNPINSIGRVFVKMEEYALKSRITIHNFLGKEVMEVYNGSLNKGEQTFNIDVSGLPSGIYYVALVAKGIKENKRVNIIH